jgi:hypothetical protein
MIDKNTVIMQDAKGIFDLARHSAMVKRCTVVVVKVKLGVVSPVMEFSPYGDMWEFDAPRLKTPILEHLQDQFLDASNALYEKGTKLRRQHVMRVGNLTQLARMV